uniref:Uncharacterized protein n=1 Tax=Solanum tuberosum TaxID=4113 RepID=M1B6A8_SOLTU
MQAKLHQGHFTRSQARDLQALQGLFMKIDVLEHTLMSSQGFHVMKIALEDKIGGNDDSTYGLYLNHKSRTARCGRYRSDIWAAESLTARTLDCISELDTAQIQA